MTPWGRKAPSSLGLCSTGQEGAATSPQARLCLNSSPLGCRGYQSFATRFQGVRCTLMQAFRTSCRVCSGFSPRSFTALSPHENGFLQNRMGCPMLGVLLGSRACEARPVPARDSHMSSAAISLSCSPWGRCEWALVHPWFPPYRHPGSGCHD